MLTEKQKKERRDGIGGSDMSIILGLSQYKTPLMLYLEKKGLMESSYVETEQQRWGNKLEGTIRQHFATTHSVDVTEPDTFVHPVLNYMRGNVDGYIPAWDAILEIKCADKFNKQEWGAHESDDIPLSYLVQVAHYCLVSNAERAIIAVLIGGNEYREFSYVRDKEIEERILEAASLFWSCFKNDEMPPCTNIDDLKLKYSHPKPLSVIETSSQIMSCLEKLRDIREQLKTLTQSEEKYKFKVMNYMGDHEYLLDAAEKTLVTWKKLKNGNRTFLIK